MAARQQIACLIHGEIFYSLGDAARKWQTDAKHIRELCNSSKYDYRHWHILEPGTDINALVEMKRAEQRQSKHVQEAEQ